MLPIFALILLFHPTVGIERTTLYQEITDYHNDTLRKAEFAYEAVNIIHKSFRHWFLTITFCEFTYFENRILKYTENYGYGYNVMLINSCPYTNKTIVKPRINNHGRTAYLVTSNYLSIEMSEAVIEALKRTGVFKPRSPVIFVVNIPLESDQYFYHELKNHFQLLWSRGIPNSVLIVKSDRLRMYMYNPFLQQVHDITGVKDVNRYLAQQYNNLYGYTLRVSVFRKTFVSDKSGPLLCDSNLVRTVISFLNATCLPVPVRDGHTIGDIYEDGTVTGITADLMEGYTDLELNSRMLKNSYYGYIDSTYPMEQDELCFLVKKSDMQSAFNTTMQLISVHMFLLFAFTVIIFIVITISARKIEKIIFNIEDNQATGTTVVNLIKCFLRQTVDFPFNGPIFRCLILLIVIYALVIGCAIDGIITSAITYPRYKPDINTLSALGNSSLTLGIYQRHYTILYKSVSADFSKTKNRVEIFNDRKIKDALDNRQFQYAILMKKTDAQRIVRKPSNLVEGKPLYYVVPDCPLPIFVVYGLRYGSPYLPRLDYILKQLVRGGILQHWVRVEDDIVRRKLMFNTASKEKKPLNIFNLQETFFLLLIGQAISVFVFILELLYHKFNKNEK